MKSFFAAALFVVGALAQSFTINTPLNAVVCQPLLLSWSGGTAPYFLSILPGSQPNGAALVDLGQVSGTSFTWTVNQPVGTSLGLTLRDSNGLIAQSASFTVNPGTDTSCVGKSSSASGSGSSSTSTVGNTSASSGTTTTGGVVTTSTTTNAGTAPSTVTSTKSTGSSTSSSTSAAASSTTSKSAAGSKFAGISAVGLVGAAAVAILA